MSTWRLILAFVLGLGLVFGFWMYGCLRTMQETVGFNIQTTSISILFTAALSTPIILFLFLGFKLILKIKAKANTLAISIFYLSIILGSSVSECWILQDERNFSREISQISPTEVYSRARAWPNEAALLVFVPNEGIHATD